MYRSKYYFLLILTIFSFTLLNSDELILGTGFKDKGYYNLGKSIQKVLKDNNFSNSIIIKETRGSTDNLIKLKNGEVDLAIVQSDIAYYAQTGKNSFKNRVVDNFSTVLSFYKEPIFIVTTEKRVNSIVQLANLRINIGPRESGLADSAKVLLHSAKILDSVFTYHAKVNKSIELLNANKVQAIFVNHLDGVLEDGIRSGKYYIVPISKNLIEHLNNTFPYFFIYKYRIDDYEVINTLSTYALLIANNNLKQETINSLVKILDKNYNKLIFPKNSKISKNHFSHNPLDSWHEGTMLYFTQNNIDTSNHVKIDLYIIYIIVSIFLSIVISIIIIIFILHNADFFHRYRQSHKIIKLFHAIYNKIIEKKYLFLSILIVTIYIIFAFLIKYFEHVWAIENNITSEFDNLSLTKNLSWLFIFASSGYNGDLFPNSQEGKLLATMVPLLGVGGMFAFIGLITFDQFKKHVLEVNGMVKRRVKDHIILCGWNETSHFILENLLHKNITHKRQIVILADGKHEESIKKYQLDPIHIFYVKGEATSRDALDRANIADADIAIVISEDNNRDDPDARIILKVLTIEKYCHELELSGVRSNRANIHTIAEINDPQNISIAKDAGVDQVISLGNIESKIFTQAVLNPGVAVFINEIMTYNDQNDIYSFTVSKDSKLYNKTYDEILLILREFNILLMSINVENRRNKVELENLMKQYNLKSKVITNPILKTEQDYKVNEGDLLIVLAQYGHIVEKALKEIKI